MYSTAKVAIFIDAAASFFYFYVVVGKQSLRCACFQYKPSEKAVGGHSASVKCFNLSNCITMTRNRTNKNNRTSVWVAILAIFLIILLVIWLTFADLTGNTDVAAFLAPYIVSTKII